MASSSNRSDFRNYKVILKYKSRRLNKFIRKHLENEGITVKVSAPPRIKALIKLVKYWYKEFVSPQGNGTDLDNIEQATLNVWKKSNSPKTINMAIAFKAVMEEFRNYNPYCGTSNSKALSTFKQVVINTLNMRMFEDVTVTKNWCRKPEKTTPGAKTATVSKPIGENNKGDFRELLPKDLDKFIAEQLQPDKDFHQLATDALENLYDHLQQHWCMESLTMKCLIKGGSIGKGTALKGRSDLDCILVMNGVGDAPKLKQKIHGILSELERLLDKDPLKGWGITIIRVNSFLVHIEMHHSKRNESVDVDILPTFYANVKDEKSRRLLYESMREYDDDTRQFCSAALAELQRDFMKPKPAKLKNLIRLVKYWCKTYLPNENGQNMPNSYLIELLTIKVWENAGGQESFETASLFENVMRELCNPRLLNVTWDDYYESSKINAKSSPRIVDPANPYNNVYEIVKGWKRVKRVAKETLNKPLLQSNS